MMICPSVLWLYKVRLGSQSAYFRQLFLRCRDWTIVFKLLKVVCQIAISALFHDLTRCWHVLELAMFFVIVVHAWLFADLLWLYRASNFWRALLITKRIFNLLRLELSDGVDLSSDRVSFLRFDDACICLLDVFRCLTLDWLCCRPSCRFILIFNWDSCLISQLVTWWIMILRVSLV